MANLQEHEEWAEGIYRIELTDPVIGGEDGISNIQAKQLGGRTLYLKQEIETAQSELRQEIEAAQGAITDLPAEIDARIADAADGATIQSSGGKLTALDVSVPNAVAALGYASTAKGLGQIGRAVSLNGSSYSIDDYIEEGLFYFPGGTAPSGWPVGVNGFLRVSVRASGSVILQEVFRATVNQYAFRMKPDGETPWLNWLYTGRETQIVASGAIGGFGALGRSFNVASATRLDVGKYYVTFMNALSGSPLVFVSTTTGFFGVDISSPSANGVYITLRNISANAYVDGDFLFIATVAY